MSFKLFDTVSIEENMENVISNEDMKFILTKSVEQINLEVSLIEAQVLLDQVNLESADYMDRWKEFCETTGKPFDSTISKEALVSEKEGSTGLITRFAESIKDRFGELNTILHTFAGFNVDKVERLISDIESGKLVPKKELDRVTKERLQDKWAPFFVLSNSLAKSEDIIKYLKEPVDNINNGNYDGFISKHWKIMWSGGAKASKQYKSIQLDLDKLKMKLKVSDKQKEDVVISFLIKRFGPKLNMYSMLYTETMDYEGKSMLNTSNPFYNNIDILPIPSKYIEDIKPLSKDEMLKILKWLVKSNRDITKAITESKFLFHKYNAKGFLLSLVAGVHPVISGLHMAHGGRAITTFVTHIGNVTKDMIYYDKLIEELVSAMYESK